MEQHFNGPVATKAIILKDEKVLVVQSRRGKWELPGGHLNVQEDLESALRREIMEELGVDINIEKIIHSDQIFHQGDGVFMLFITFQVALRNTNQPFKLLSDEIADTQWIDREGMKGLDCYEDCKKALDTFWNL